MYTALYRKWRPKKFSEVVGQEHITKTLLNEITTDRLSHAYLFVGSRGTGKTTCARILAKAINCPDSSDGEPCCECEICRGIDDGSVLDIVEIDAASNNGVDNIRDLREEANFLPARTKYRVYIIDEVHMLSGGAFNALLKILEEPPEHIKFILATTEPQKMPATILSRCQRFDFRRIQPEEMSERLEYVASHEGVTLTADAALLISRLADGAMRDALSIMDQCMVISRDIDTKIVSKVTGLAQKEYLAETAKAIYNKDGEKLLSIVDNLHENSCDMERYCTELIEYFRNIMVTRAVEKPEKLIVCPREELEEIKGLSRLFTLPAAIAAIGVLQDTYTAIKAGAECRTAMEMALIKLSSPELDKCDESVLKRLSALEETLKNGEFSGIKPVSYNQTEPTFEPVRKDAESTAQRKLNEAKEPAVIAENSGSADSSGGRGETENTVSDFSASQHISAPKTEENAGIAPFRQWPEVLREVMKADTVLWSLISESTAETSGKSIIVDASSNPAGEEVLSLSEKTDTILKCVYKVTSERYGAVLCAKDADEFAADIKDKKDPLSLLMDKAIDNGIKINMK